MEPINFKQSNVKLGKPEGMTDEQCGSLPAFTDGKQVVSCWKMSFKERINALLFGRVWLSVQSGKTQPPVWNVCEKTCFND